MSIIESLNPKRQDGYPIIIEISAVKNPVRLNAKDPAFDKPLSALQKDYQQQGRGVLIFKIR